MTDFELMGAALDEARKAAALGEVPVGAVVARNGQIVAAAHNTRETEKNALHHAELLAIDAACKALGGWRLWECELLEQGLRAEEAGALLQAFFKDLRVRLAARPKWKRPAPPAENMKKP